MKLGQKQNWAFVVLALISFVAFQTLSQKLRGRLLAVAWFGCGEAKAIDQAKAWFGCGEGVVNQAGLTLEQVTNSFAKL